MELIKPFFAPRVLSLKQVPMALFQVALLGAVVGPLIGLLIAWFLLPAAVSSTPRGAPLTLGGWVRYAVPAGMVYALVFYGVFGLGLGYVRVRYRPSRKVLWLLGIVGWFAALLLLAAFLPSGEWFSESVRARSIRVLASTTIVFVLLSVFRASLDRIKAEKAAAEAQAQVRALQAQINPHFFFNTLNTIYALIPVDPAAAQRTVGLLADMSRHAFASAQADLIPLAEELQFAGAYLEIEKVRYANRLQCELPEADQLEGIRVPALSLQPLIENAIRHGIARRIDGGKVRVEVDRDAKRGQFSLTVTNDCESPSDGKERSSENFFRRGDALENIRERLNLHYGDRASLLVSFPRPDAVAVTLRGPLQ